MPLQSRFLTQLDVRSDKLLKLFEKRGGQIGKRLERTLAPMTQEDYVDAGRECVLKWLCVYLNEDPANLVREFVAEDEAAIKESIEDTTVGIFVVKNDATSGPEDVGIVLEGLQIMQGLDNTALAAAILFGLMLCRNLIWQCKGCSVAVATDCQDEEFVEEEVSVAPLDKCRI
ncbi:unnamed protein product [Gadus morhua 'NCC']